MKTVPGSRLDWDCFGRFDLVLFTLLSNTFVPQSAVLKTQTESFWECWDSNLWQLGEKRDCAMPPPDQESVNVVEKIIIKSFLLLPFQTLGWFYVHSFRCPCAEGVGICWDLSVIVGLISHRKRWNVACLPLSQIDFSHYRRPAWKQQRLILATATPVTLGSHD